MECLDGESMASVEKQEKIEDERKIMKNKKKKLGGIKTMPFILGMYVCIPIFLFLSYNLQAVSNFLLFFLFGIFQVTLS
jgi:uncharacterized membrane protein (DUF106 family)